MSEQPKWTPGPWTVTDCDNAGGTGRKSASLICSACRPSVDNPGMDEFDILAEVIGPPPVSADKRKANARLIAAAPELAEVARLVVEYFGNEEISPVLNCDIRLRDAARAALAKARGDA